MIKPLPVSGFKDNLPENQIVEENIKEIIKKNYTLCGFTPLDTPVIERLEVLVSKGGDDNEIYGIHRINGEKYDDSELGLRFDLTVPLARYVGQFEGELTFPFRRQHIARSYRGERPQKGRFREFYQADVDIIGNKELPMIADVEVINTIYMALKDIKFGKFCININNKKFLTGFLESIDVKNIKEAISIIDKKDKVSSKELKEMFYLNNLSDFQIGEILEFILFSKKNDSKSILSNYSQIDNTLLKEGLIELKVLYNGLISMGVEKDYLKINTAISRGLNYYTGTVFETFIEGEEKLGSIASGGRYDNLAENFSKNNYPGVGGSLGLTRLISVLEKLGKINPFKKTVSEVLVLNLGDSFYKKNLELIDFLRSNGINSELYLDSKAKMQKQLKYANNIGIPYVIIIGQDELDKGVTLFKDMNSGEQIEIQIGDELIKKIR